jgi:hypothetical protein
VVTGVAVSFGRSISSFALQFFLVEVDIIQLDMNNGLLEETERFSDHRWCDLPTLLCFMTP